MRRPKQHTTRVRGLTALTALALSGSLLWAAPAAVAEEATIPQAPTFSVISAEETLPFTGTDGSAIEVAVLTPGQNVGSATWTTTDELELAPYEGQKIRVLARAQGVTDAEQYFDATYDVRDAYESAVGLGTETNPVEAVLASSPKITGWATGYENYEPGPNVDAQWKTPENAVGSIAGNPDDPYSDNTTVVVLGDHGEITMTFDNPIADGTGYDLAVFENGFRVSGQQLDFIELGRVQVSSNGTDFVEFDTGSTNGNPVAAYGGAPANQYGGIAGRDLNSYGTPFDLAVLKNKPEVRSGAVDLGSITDVKIVDIVGDGEDLDSFGRPIYDSYPTYGSGGFDLRAVAALNQSEPTINRVEAVLRDETTVGVSADIATGDRPYVSSYVEWASTPDYSDAFRQGVAYVAGPNGTQRVRMDAWGLESGKTYWYRVGVEDGSGEIAVTGWKQFSMVDPLTVKNVSSYTYDDHALVTMTMKPGRQSGKHTARIEYAPAWDDGPSLVTDAQTVEGEGESALRFELTDVPQGMMYNAELVVENADGREVWRSTAAYVYLPGQLPGQDGTRISEITGRTATVDSMIMLGSYGSADVRVEYTTDVDDAEKLQVTEPERFDQIDQLQSTLDGLTPGARYWARVVVTPVEQAFAGGETKEFAGDWVRFSSDAAPRALGTAKVSEVTGESAKVTVPVTPKDFERSVTVEYTDDPDLSDRRTSDAVVVGPDGDARDTSFELTDLTPGTPYWVRPTSAVGDQVERGDWVRFSTSARPGASLPVTATKAPVKVGATTTIAAKGLAAGERFEVFIGSVRVAQGTASPQGAVSVSAKVPSGLADARHTVRVVGSGSDRAGTAGLRVVRAKKLSVKTSKAKVKRGTRQKVVVRGLAPSEPVTVTVLGKTYQGKATSKGTFTRTVKVSKKTKVGTKKVTVRGLDKSRNGTKKFKVRK